MESKAVIFDYNRTVFNPESGTLNQGVSELLVQLRGKGFKLFLISKGNEDRGKQIEELGLYDSFDHITVVQEKSSNDFQGCLELCPPDTRFYVVGDRVKKEIRLGRELGMKTIWYKQGKFSNELPEEESEKPDYTISSFDEILKIIESA